MSTITVYSLYDYNCGDIYSKDFDLDLFDNLEEFHQALHQWLSVLSEAIDDDVEREEWLFADWEDIPSKYISEYGLSPEYFEYLQVIDELTTYIDANDVEAVVMTWIEYGYDLCADTIQEYYRGRFTNNYDFVHEHFICDREVPKYLEPYIDCDAIARDCLINDYFEANGFLFLRY